MTARKGSHDRKFTSRNLTSQERRRGKRERNLLCAVIFSPNNENVILYYYETFRFLALHLPEFLMPLRSSLLLPNSRSFANVFLGRFCVNSLSHPKDFLTIAHHYLFWQQLKLFLIFLCTHFISFGWSIQGQEICQTLVHKKARHNVEHLWEIYESERGGKTQTSSVKIFNDFFANFPPQHLWHSAI
jgi:hypothetical protein